MIVLDDDDAESIEPLHEFYTWNRMTTYFPDRGSSSWGSCARECNPIQCTHGTDGRTWRAHASAGAGTLGLHDSTPRQRSVRLWSKVHHPTLLKKAKSKRGARGGKQTQHDGSGYKVEGFDKQQIEHIQPTQWRAQNASERFVASQNSDKKSCSSRLRLLGGPMLAR